MFIAKPSEIKLLALFFEDFHCQEYIQIFDINCGLFMRLHFTSGCENRRRTSRRRHGFQVSGIQILFADHVHRRSRVYHQFSEGEKNAVLSFSFNFRIFLANFHAASRAHRIGCSMFELFRIIDEDFGGSIS